MYAKFSKCEFCLTEVKLLGRVMSTSGVSVDLEKVEAVMSWERPKSVFEIRSFLGLAGYYDWSESCIHSSTVSMCFYSSTCMIHIHIL